jgi:hypothetical protein
MAGVYAKRRATDIEKQLNPGLDDKQIDEVWGSAQWMMAGLRIEFNQLKWPDLLKGRRRGQIDDVVVRRLGHTSTLKPGCNHS